MQKTTAHDKVQLLPRLQPQHTTTAATAQTPTYSHSGSSRSSSRRTSSVVNKEPLPTPPPDPRANSSENIFKFPPTKQDFPSTFHGLMDFKERQTDFYKKLNRTIAEDCQQLHGSAPENEHIEEIHRCEGCTRIREECDQFLGPFQQRASASISASLAAYGAMEQLARMYAIWDQYLDVDKRLRKRKECLKYLSLLEKKANEELETIKNRNSAASKQHLSDTEVELEQSINLLDTILSNERTDSLKRVDVKPQRERSKSVMVDEVLSAQQKERDLAGRPLMRRQSTYSDGKAKVSKWTKVKAAFKWERANVPALHESHKESVGHVGLTPINHEVARYLRVPSAPCGAGSSADSVLSSSSGHFLSEAGGTPGTISSASSLDDLDNQRVFHDMSRRDSAKSDTIIELGLNKTDCNLGVVATKSPSNKSFRKSKIISDFEVLPEDVIADIKCTPTRRTKLPPSPLDLTIKQDLNDLENFYSPNTLKSPRDAGQRSKKLNSPGNSSVPSSPSRHSDFFAEFESEDLSSGELSDPNTPSHKTLQQKQNEINQRYQLLRAKLDIEFEAKRQQWEKLKTNPNTCRALALITNPNSEDTVPKAPAIQNLSTKQLEENLTPEFKKKLRKWRVKKQVPIGTSQSHHQMPMSPTTESKAKIDWHLWKTGQIKLNGQGLSPLPDQKSLPEDFQKKLEQWDKIKRGGAGVAVSGQNSIKRSVTKAEVSKRNSDEDKRSDKYKMQERDKTEKLGKFKAIGKLTEHPVKKIEVKTSAGVMKFEGISRKFTRKLYEWEKARGIGPESSTFALLHPGYCPIDVGGISKDHHKIDNSPTLSRSLSLDSISIPGQLPAISHQASSLSLNDVKDLKDLEIQSNTDIPDGDVHYKKYEEPEAVMVEVEDHIVETACPLITAQGRPEIQTPVYKYEEVVCNDYCNLKRVISYESNTNIAPLLTALSHTEKSLTEIKKIPIEFVHQPDIVTCESALNFVRQVYPFYTENLAKSNVLNAISDVHSELSRLDDLNRKCPWNEACCQEIITEYKEKYSQDLKGLYETLEILRQKIHDGNRYPKEALPDINITSEDGLESSMYTPYHTSSKDHLSTTLEATDEVSAPAIVDKEIKIQPTVHRTNSVTAAKKKFRLRKVGSRQNSKTESDSSEEGMMNALETPRRIKRKNFRLKQRSFDDDYRRFEPVNNSDKIENDPKHKREQSMPAIMSKASSEKTTSRSLIALNESSTLFSIPEPTTIGADISLNSNVFVKTKRKVFTTVKAPTTTDGIAVIEHDLEPVEQTINETPQPDTVPEASTAQETNVSKPKTNLTLTCKPPSLVSQKSQSLEDIPHNTEQNLRSAESLQRLDNSSCTVKCPLASDSFRVNLKNCFPLKKEGMSNSPRNSWVEPKREHLFKKHSLPLTKSIGATVKKIETKLAKTNSGSSMERIIKHDQTDNTIPRIYRRSSRHSLTPTTKYSTQYKFDYPAPPSSEPSSPFVELSDKPTTPLSERAQKLRKAKEEFLAASLARDNDKLKQQKEGFLRKQSADMHRQSDLSLSSTAGHEGNGELSQSASVDTFMAASLQSDAGTDMDSSQFDSLPRVSRSAKITSKLGFATLASKFRRSKGKKDKDSASTTSSASGSALSKLCKQTLMADIVTGPQMARVEERVYGVARQECIAKSSSTPVTSASTENQNASLQGQVRREIERLNKSQSDKTVKLKESYV